MKTVRFTQVVEKSGRPEAYLLFSKNDAAFRQALKAGRIMTVHSDGAKTDYGVLGYQDNARAQILIFPRSLKSFAGKKIVAIKYDLLRKEPSSQKEIRPKIRERKIKILPVVKPVPKEKIAKGKLLEFPSHEEEPEEDFELKAKVRRAMKALEEGKSLVAFNILKSILEP